MKSIEQLLELTNNPYYSMTNDEQERLDAFLVKKSAQQPPVKNNSSSSVKSTRANVKANNVVEKHDPSVPSESAAVGIKQSILADSVS